MLLLDAHVHVYPFHDAGKLLSGAVGRLAGFAPPGASLGIVLVERDGQDVFGQWAAGNLPDGWSSVTLDRCAIRLDTERGERLHVFAGRQIACAERLEILGIGTRVPVPDGATCEEAIAAIAKDGGLPALSWGVGKWMFRRAGIVRRLLDRHEPEALALCDTSLRPSFWPRPAAMCAGSRPVLCGSDPLPRPGEERQAGRYACEVPLDLPSAEPSKMLISALRHGGLVPCGSRNSAVEFLSRH